VAGERLLLQHCLHLSTQAIKASAHIGHAGSDPYPEFPRQTGVELLENYNFLSRE
jgi:hypothetical protein